MPVYQACAELDPRVMAVGDEKDALPCDVPMHGAQLVERPLQSTRDLFALS